MTDSGKQKSRTYRLNRTLNAMLKLGGNKRELWPSTREIAAEAGICNRTAGRHIDELVRHGVLVLKYPANMVSSMFENDPGNDGGVIPVRYPATYVLNRREFRKLLRQASSPPPRSGTKPRSAAGKNVVG